MCSSNQEMTSEENNVLPLEMISAADQIKIKIVLYRCHIVKKKLLIVQIHLHEANVNHMGLEVVSRFNV